MGRENSAQNRTPEGFPTIIERMSDSLAACPCIDAHRRLMDVHEDIHRAAENYHDAEEFRRWINSAIQNARGVTFLLQKRKASWPDFDSWYGAWVEESKKNDVLVWSVTSRNKIVKEQDLATLSLAEVTLYGARLTVAKDTLTVPPSASARDILSIVAKRSPSPKGASFKRSDPIKSPVRDAISSVRVRRKWIDSALPDLELVSALREVYQGLARVVGEAHTQSGVVGTCDVPAFRRECVTSEISQHLGCIPPTLEGSTVFLDLATGQISEFEYVSMKVDPSAPNRYIDKYGEPPKFSGGPMGELDSRLTFARQLLQLDGFAVQVLLFYWGEQIVKIVPINFEDGQPREVKIELAVEGLGARQYDGVIFVSELWIGELDERGNYINNTNAAHALSDAIPYDPDPVGGRDEALWVIAITAYEPPRHLLQGFTRRGNNYDFEEPIVGRGWNSLPPLLRPVIDGLSENPAHIDP